MNSLLRLCCASTFQTKWPRLPAHPSPALLLFCRSILHNRLCAVVYCEDHFLLNKVKLWLLSWEKSNLMMNGTVLNVARCFQTHTQALTKERFKLEDPGFSFFQSDSEVLLIFSTEHQDSVETLTASWLPAGQAQNIWLNFPASGRTCAVSIFFQMWKFAFRERTHTGFLGKCVRIFLKLFFWQFSIYNYWAVKVIPHLSSHLKTLRQKEKKD